jgi:predicted DNA-binding transcriptional regulator AlpA
MTTTTDIPLLNTRQVMARLGIKDPQKIYDLVRDRKLAAVNFGTDKRATWRFAPSDVEAYLASRRVGPLPSVPVAPKSIPVPMRNTLRRAIASLHA